MWPFWIGLPSLGWLAGRDPLRLRISGNRLILLGGRWIATKRAAGKFGLSPATTCSRTSTAPADPPSTTTISVCRAKSCSRKFRLLLRVSLYMLVLDPMCGSWEKPLSIQEEQNDGNTNQAG